MNNHQQQAGMARRSFLRLGAAVVATAMLPSKLWAAMVRPASAFKATGIDETFAEMGATPSEHDGIMLETPDIAENGATVPVKVEVDSAKLPGATKVYILVEKNPNPLTAMFGIPEGTEAFVETRVKVAQTGNIYAVVEAGGKTYMKAKETKVTLGGCGG